MVNFYQKGWCFFMFIKGKLIKYLSLLLGLLLLLTACVGNQPSTDDSSTGDPSDNSSAHSNNVSSDTSTVARPTLLEPVNRKNSAFNVSRGKTYSFSQEPDESYPDDGVKLTDDSLVSQFNHDSWVGFPKGSNMQVLLDLGEVEDGLADFSVGVYRRMEFGIGLPSSVRIEVSDDNENFLLLGMAYPSADEADNAATWISIKLQKSISARYVRFTFGVCETAWLFLGELEVLRYDGEEQEKVPYYGEIDLPEADTPSYWPEGEQNTETVNLLANKIPSVRCDKAIAGDLYCTEYYNSIRELPRLTDGRYAPTTNYQNNEYVHFVRYDSRELIFDLEHTSAVSGMQLSFLQDAGPSIFWPSYIAFFVSENGKDWERVACVNDMLGERTDLFRKEYIFEKTYRARFVKFSFPTVGHIYCDELQVYGSTAIPSHAVAPVPNEEELRPEDIGYPSPDDFCGVENLLLSYNCVPDENGVHPEEGMTDLEEYRPYVGYYDQNGNLQDTFFDGYLFLPYGKFSTTDLIRTMDGWKYYMDDVFMEDRNLSALNQAVNEVCDQLNKPDYHCKAFLSVLYPYQTLRDGRTNYFGDLNGDGKNDSLDKEENRIAAVLWMMEQQYTRFLQAGYDKLDFGGFYWYEENLIVHCKRDLDLVKAAAAYAHSLGVKFFWIPYYTASGYDIWQDYDFDIACMQPNYMFGQPAYTLPDTAEKAKHYGLGVEIEFDTAYSPESVRRYLQYLQAGVEYGFVNSVKMYYQGCVPGALYEAWASEDPYARSAYDLTYQFAKGLLTTELPAYEIDTTEFTLSGRKSTVGKISVSSETYARVILSTSPLKGDLRLNMDGTFTYYRHENAPADDQFEVVLDFGYAKSEPILITLKAE